MPDILDRTHAAIEAAMADGAELERWHMTQPGWLHIDDDPAHRAEARKAYCGGAGHRPLYGLPVEIVPGSAHAFELICAGGRKYDEHGLITYPRRVVAGH